jgi:hypothetical protein
LIELGTDKKYVGKESDLQKTVAKWMRYQFPNLLWFHVHNEGKHKVQYRKKQASMGVLAGVSDIIIFEPRGEYHGACIELKVKGGKVRENQIDFLGRAEKAGYFTAVCWNFQAAKEIIESYVRNGHWEGA